MSGLSSGSSTVLELEEVLLEKKLALESAEALAKAKESQELLEKELARIKQVRKGMEKDHKSMRDELLQQQGEIAKQSTAFVTDHVMMIAKQKNHTQPSQKSKKVTKKVMPRIH